MRKANALRGFTLIEVLAALVIVSLGMLGVIQAVSQTVNNVNYVREKTMAHWVAMNRLTEVRVANAIPPVRENSGQLEMGGQRWRWTMTVTQTPVKSIRRIDIRVALASADEKASLAAVTGFYGTAINPIQRVVNWQGVATNGAPGTTPQTGAPTATPMGQPSPGLNPGQPPPPDEDDSMQPGVRGGGDAR